MTTLKCGGGRRGRATHTGQSDEFQRDLSITSRSASELWRHRALIGMRLFFGSDAQRYPNAAEMSRKWETATRARMIKSPTESNKFIQKASTNG